MIIKAGAANTAQLFIVDSTGTPVVQVAPFPKITISRVSAPAADLVVGASMSIVAAGEFAYAWTPPIVGQYRAKYEAMNGVLSVFSFDDFDAVDIVGALPDVVYGEALVGTIPAGDTVGMLDSEVELIGVVAEY